MKMYDVINPMIYICIIKLSVLFYMDLIKLKMFVLLEV